MMLLKWIWVQEEEDLVDPAVIYYTLRLVMLVLSFVLEDWAVHELVRSPRLWRQAVLLVTSSYVTWTFQTHTFSNSVETLVVLWSLVLIERILRENVCLVTLSTTSELTLCPEAVSHRLQHCVGLSSCFWNFQSDYFSCVYFDTRHTTVATLLG